MRVLLIGANSYVGQSVSRRLKKCGFDVAALARTEEIAASLHRREIAPVRGGIENIVQVTDNLRDYDACVWMSFLSLDAESAAVRAAIAGLEGSGKIFIFTSGTAVLGIPSYDGAWSDISHAEDDAFTPPAWLVERVATENCVRAAARRDVRAIVIRPPLIWGHGGSRQIPWIFETVEKARAACYVGQGLNVYSHVHVDDLAEVYRLALEKGRPGGLYHAVAGEVNFRTIAEAVAEVTGCEARSVSYDEMCATLGRSVTRTAFAINSRSRCPRTQSDLGWSATNVGLIEDIRNGSYRRRFAPGR